MSGCFAKRSEFPFWPMPKELHGSLSRRCHKGLLAKNERNQESSFNRVYYPCGIDPAAASDPITSLPGAWLLSSSMNMQSPYRSAGAECAGDNSNAVTFGLSFRQRKRLQRSVEQKLRHRLLAALYEHANELESSAFPSLHHRKQGWPSD